MGTQINIMGLEIDIIGTDALLSIVDEFLEDDVLNVILFATTDLIDQTVEYEELKNLVMDADYILPGDETLLSLHHVDTLKIASMVVDCESLASIFGDVNLKGRSIYAVASNEKDASAYMNFVKEHYPHMEVLGTFREELEQNQELAINEINSLTPDILIFLTDTPFQERFIMENKSKLNAKLCIGLGHVPLETMIGHKNKGIKKILDTRIFKRKVEKYKHKKGGKMNGDNQ